MSWILEEMWLVFSRARSRLVPSRWFAFLRILSFLPSRFFNSEFILPIFVIVRHWAFRRMWSVRFWRVICGFSEGFARLVRDLVPSTSILFISSGSFIMKGVVIWWSVGIPEFTIDQFEALL